MDGEEWNFTAVGPEKRRLSGTLIRRLKQKFAPGGLLHYGQGKWYPGESLPRWALACYWRKDGLHIWNDESLFANDTKPYNHTQADAQRFITQLTQILGVKSRHIMPAYEDAWYYLWRERKLPSNVDPLASRLDDPEERARLVKVLRKAWRRSRAMCCRCSALKERRAVGPAARGFCETNIFSWFPAIRRSVCDCRWIRFRGLANQTTRSSMSPILSRRCRRCRIPEPAVSTLQARLSNQRFNRIINP